MKTELINRLCDHIKKTYPHLFISLDGYYRDIINLNNNIFNCSIMLTNNCCCIIKAKYFRRKSTFSTKYDVGVNINFSKYTKTFPSINYNIAIDCVDVISNTIIQNFDKFYKPYEIKDLVVRVEKENKIIKEKLDKKKLVIYGDLIEILKECLYEKSGLEFNLKEDYNKFYNTFTNIQPIIEKYGYFCGDVHLRDNGIFVSILTAYSNYKMGKFYTDIELASSEIIAFLNGINIIKEKEKELYG